MIGCHMQGSVLETLCPQALQVVVDVHYPRRCLVLWVPVSNIQVRVGSTEQHQSKVVVVSILASNVKSCSLLDNFVSPVVFCGLGKSVCECIQGVHSQACSWRPISFVILEVFQMIHLKVKLA